MAPTSDRTEEIRKAMQALVASARQGRAGESKDMPDVAPSRSSPVHAPAAPLVSPRPESKSEATRKEPISLRLDADLLEVLRGGGRGWQTRVNRHLRHAVGLEDGAPPEDLFREPKKR